MISNSFRKILHEDSVGFMSLQNAPSHYDAALLLAFGPRLDPLAWQLWCELEGSKTWTKCVIRTARTIRWRMMEDEYGSDRVPYEVMLEKFEVPPQSIDDAKQIAVDFMKGIMPKDWLNGA